MKELLVKYSNKLVQQGLCKVGDPVLGGLDADLVFNKNDSSCGILTEVINSLNINSILFSRPAEPFFSIFNYLINNINETDSAIYPQDTETRTFLHDIPVSKEFSSKVIVEALKRRKCIVIADKGIVTYGTVSPEQAFITYSSVCFSLFVKFFTDFLYDAEKNNVAEEQQRVLKDSIKSYRAFLDIPNDSIIKIGPFKSSDEIIQSIHEAGMLTVRKRLVDSFFGNISYRSRDTIYISQTGSSLDELEACIDACPIDDSSSIGVTASSELSAHKEIYLTTENKAILHGHPKFCVVLSLFCKDKDCSIKGNCYIKCTKERYIKDIPIVPGEVGTGRYGLNKTLPPAIKDKRGVIVYGHGLFTVGKKDFSDAFQNLLDIEATCFSEYVTKIERYL